LKKGEWRDGSFEEESGFYVKKNGFVTKRNVPLPGKLIFHGRKGSKEEILSRKVRLSLTGKE